MKIFNNLKYILGLLAILMLSNACNDYIEEEIYSDITSENFITQDNADQLVVGLYGSLREVYRDYTFEFLGTDIFATKGETFSFSATNDYFNLNSGIGLSVWSNNYSVIAKANTVINRFENQINWSDANLGNKDYGIAQAKALRALGFFNLVQQYGGVGKLQYPIY